MKTTRPNFTFDLAIFDTICIVLVYGKRPEWLCWSLCGVYNVEKERNVKKKKKKKRDSPTSPKRVSFWYNGISITHSSCR